MVRRWPRSWSWSIGTVANHSNDRANGSKELQIVLAHIRVDQRVKGSADHEQGSSAGERASISYYKVGAAMAARAFVF